MEKSGLLKKLKNTAIHIVGMAEKYFVDIVIRKEKLSTGKPVFVAHCPSLGIASQGSTVEQAKANIKEAIGLYLEEQPDKCIAS